MKNKCEEKFTHLFYLYESWCGSSGGRTGRTFADKFYTGMVSHLNGQRRSSLGPSNVGTGRPTSWLYGGWRSPAFPSVPAVSAWPSEFPNSPGPAGTTWLCTVTSRTCFCLGNNHSLTINVQLLTSSKVSAVSETKKVNHMLQIGFCILPPSFLTDAQCITSPLLWDFSCAVVCRKKCGLSLFLSFFFLIFF
jgi:hypothetical protein